MAYIKKTNNPKMGRPKTNRSIDFHLRLTPEEQQTLEKCCKMVNKTKTETIMQAINLLHTTLTLKDNTIKATPHN